MRSFRLHLSIICIPISINYQTKEGKMAPGFQIHIKLSYNLSNHWHPRLQNNFPTFPEYQENGRKANTDSSGSLSKIVLISTRLKDDVYSLLRLGNEVINILPSSSFRLSSLVYLPSHQSFIMVMTVNLMTAQDSIVTGSSDISY